MSHDGRDVRRLVEGTGPRWSPDGSQFAYIVDDEEKTRYVGTSVWVMNPDTGGTRRVANAESVGALAWAPDGRHLAYMDGIHVVVLDMETGGREPVSIDFIVGSLDWSPDGRRLLVDAKILELATGAERSLWRKHAPTRNGRWSPDGQRMALARMAPVLLTKRSRQVVVVARGDGGRPEPVTRGPFDSEPAWSHDGRRIYFTRVQSLLGTNQESELYVVDLDTRSVRRLTENRFADRLPDPRPSRRLSTDFPEPGFAAGNVVVPDLVGRNVHWEDEKRRFATLGLDLKPVFAQPEYGLLGFVRDQLPEGGARVAEDTVVRVDVNDLTTLYYKTEFSARVWKAHPNCAPGPRTAMYVDLYRRVLRKGMSSQRLVELLGRPGRSQRRALDWPIGQTSFVRVECICLRGGLVRRRRATRFYQLAVP